MQDFRSKDGLYNIEPKQTRTPASSAPSTPSKSRYFSEDLFSSSESSVASTSGHRPSSSPIPKLKGQDLFDVSVWKSSHTTEVFYRFIASLRQKIQDEVKEASPTHKFIRALRDGGRLMRCYTQNIDGLERREGLSMDLEHGKGTRRRFTKKTREAPRPSETRNSDVDGGCEVVPLHGDLELLRCTLCQETYPWSKEATEEFLNGLAPECSRCAMKSCNRRERGKRGVAVGSLRPNIVLYGEEHPFNQSLAPLIPFDLSSGPEILIIMGTSMRVHGLQKLVKEFAKKIHARKDGKGKVIFINRTRPAESAWENVIDSYVEMDCDDWVGDLKARREDLFLRQGELNLKVAKPTAQKRKSTNDCVTLSKKPRIVVDIPKKRRSKTPAPWKADVKEARHDSSFVTPPPSRGKKSASTQWDNKPPTSEPLTPPRSGNVSFKRSMYDNPFRRIFSTPSPPRFSPLRNTWKPSIRVGEAGVSPERPQIVSPIEERSHIYQDPDLEIAESSDGEQEGDLSVPETPTKVRVLRPCSESMLNLNMAKERSTQQMEKVSSLGTEQGGHTPRKWKRMSVA